MHYNYLIIGGGMTGDAAVAGIREVDRTGTIGLIGAELDSPYDRPPLTKGLWKGKPLEKIWRAAASEGAQLHLGRRAVALDADARTVADDRGDRFTFDKLLLATGGRPRRLPFGDGSIIYYRTLADYRRLRDASSTARRVAVIGAGFIGSEIAAALTSNGVHVLLAFPQDVIGQRIYPRDLAEYVTHYYREQGVEVCAATSVVGVDEQGGTQAVRLRPAAGGAERTEPVDAVVAGIGIEPNTELARAAGLQVDDGIVVDERLRTSKDGIYAAGDVASFYNPALDRRLRVEHEDNANTMGRMAGRSMAGQPVNYDHLPYFYSDLFDLGYEAVGELDARYETFADWQQQYRQGVVYYLREGRVRGVLLWNVWGQVDAARRLIGSTEHMRHEELKGRIPVG